MSLLNHFYDKNYLANLKEYTIQYNVQHSSLTYKQSLEYFNEQTKSEQYDSMVEAEAYRLCIINNGEDSDAEKWRIMARNIIRSHGKNPLVPFTEVELDETLDGYVRSAESYTGRIYINTDVPPGPQMFVVVNMVYGGEKVKYTSSPAYIKVKTPINKPVDITPKTSPLKELEVYAGINCTISKTRRLSKQTTRNKQGRKVKREKLQKTPQMAKCLVRTRKIARLIKHGIERDYVNESENYSNHALIELDLIRGYVCTENNKYYLTM